MEKMHGYQKIALTLKLTLSVPVFTVSFSTGYFFFFFRYTLFLFSGLFSLFLGLLSTFYIWRTRAPWCHEHLGDTSTSFVVVTQQILVGVTCRHPIGVHDASDYCDLIHVGLRELVGHTSVGPQGPQSSRHSAHHHVGLPMVSA